MMKEYLRRITNSLAFRILMPTFVIMLLAGLVFYIFILRSVSGFADEHIKGNVADMAGDIYRICDKNLNDLLIKGMLADEKSVRLKKGLTIGAIEDYMNQNGLKGAIIENEKELLRIGNFTSEFLQGRHEEIKEHTVSALKYAGNVYYETHSHFEPWGWHMLLIKDAAAYSELIRKVNRTHGVAAFLFLVVIYLALYFLNRYIRYPVSTIIKSIKKSEKPEYKGIYEFEFLSDSIRDVMERDEQLKEQLFQAQKLEAIGTLAGGIAHDFNNMLQGILGYAAYLKMKVPADDPMYEPLSVIEHSAERAADLTKKLLGFARKGKYIIEPLNMNTVVENVITITARTFDRKIKTETALNPGLWTIEGDKRQLEHVILNLCLNSRDAMPEGGILSIETFNTEITKETKPYRHMKEGKYAVIKVIDTGTGMDEETLKRIFEPFFTTKEVGKGTGMGLPMAYGVVKNHNGFIEVDSAPGKGSAFTIYLPAIGEKAEREIEIAKPLHKGKGGILVIDDEEITRNVARDILHELGYDVLLASGGKEGIKIYADKKDVIDLVILDMIMPEMGGKETFKKLKEINPDVKILISSGYGQDSLPEQVMDDGEAGFIQKPYNINEIAAIIKEVLYTA
jgi:signal transduction histidine kinase/ActR/RegA family two-component response regulator